MELKKTKILLIHPPSNVDQKIKEGLKYPPLGIAFLASVLRENGYPVRLFDGNLEKKAYIKLRGILKEFNPEVVGISFTSLLAESAHYTAKLVKDFDSSITVVAGGYHPTVMPMEVIEDQNFDLVVQGEAEVTFLEWLEIFEKQNRDYGEIKGVVFRKDNKAIRTSMRELIADIDILPMPAYDLLPLNRYSSMVSTRKPYVTFIRSRGCPFRCIFCGVQKIFGRKYRCQSPQKTISEIDTLVKKLKIKEVLFKDSDFLIDPKNVEKFCQLLIERNYDLIWSCNARVDMVDEKILMIMKQAGCKMITFGVESGDQGVLNRLKKDITIPQVITAVELTKKIGIQCTVNIIFGNPGETKESVLGTINFVKKLDPDYGNFAYLTAFPGSELYDEAIEQNWFIDGKPNSYGYEELKLNATEMSSKELSKILKYAIRSFYFRPRYIVQRLRHLSLNELKNDFKGLWGILKDY